MVWNVFGAFGNVLEAFGNVLKAFGNVLEAFEAFWERLGAFGSVSGSCSKIPYVWYGQVIMVCIKALKYNCCCGRWGSYSKFPYASMVSMHKDVKVELGYSHM